MDISWNGNLRFLFTCCYYWTSFLPAVFIYKIFRLLEPSLLTEFSVPDWLRLKSLPNLLKVSLLFFGGSRSYLTSITYLASCSSNFTCAGLLRTLLTWSIRPLVSGDESFFTSCDWEPSLFLAKSLLLLYFIRSFVFSLNPFFLIIPGELFSFRSSVKAYDFSGLMKSNLISDFDIFLMFAIGSYSESWIEPFTDSILSSTFCLPSARRFDDFFRSLDLMSYITKDYWFSSTICSGVLMSISNASGFPTYCCCLSSRVAFNLMVSCFF